LSHGWHISKAGFVVPPAGPELRALITERQKKMTPTKRSLPSNALNSPDCPLALHYLDGSVVQRMHG
jgi:hypothetical protein